MSVFGGDIIAAGFRGFVSSSPYQKKMTKRGNVKRDERSQSGKGDEKREKVFGKWSSEREQKHSRKKPKS